MSAPASEQASRSGSAVGGRGTSPIVRRLVALYGVARSLRMYWGSPRQLGRMRRFYARFVPEGGIVFDVGAHVGSRTVAFASLGARVVAVEPQPAFVRILRALARVRPGITVVPALLGEAPGRAELLVSTATPTVTTASPGFVAAVTHVPSFAWVRWDERLAVEVVTLDQLIVDHGPPDFVKIDVEGMEAEVLHGLSMALPALSFEFVPAHREGTRRALDRLAELGPYRFNVSMGESLRFELEPWCDGPTLWSWLEQRHPESASGDIYATLDETS